MVTRTDVARRAGTSTAVVSYVLNNGPRRVAPATRERVLRAIHETGYQPNRLARALRDRRSRVLGLVVPDSSNAFFAGLAQAIEEEAYRHSYFILLGNSAEDKAREAGYVRAFLEHMVDGLVLVSASSEPSLSPQTKKLLAASQVPIVLIDRDHSLPRANVLLVDNVHGGTLATEHLLYDHGAREVHCLAGPRRLALAEERVEGWRRALRANGIAPQRSWVRRSSFSRVGAREVMTEWLEEARPSALFVSSDEQAIGVLAAARKARCRVPEDLALVSFDGTPQADYTQPGLTTVEQPLAEIGRRAVELLVRSAGTRRSRRVERFPTRLRVRSSCGCAAEAWTHDPPGERSPASDDRAPAATASRSPR